ALAHLASARLRARVRAGPGGGGPPRRRLRARGLHGGDAQEGPVAPDRRGPTIHAMGAPPPPTPPAAPPSAPAVPSPARIAAALTKRVLGQPEAVREVSVALAKKLAGLRVGNILLVGSSGSGKTTLMRAVE